MFDFFRDIGKSADEGRIEALNAYLDGALSPQEQRQLEISLQQDAALRAELEQMRVVKQQLRSLPRRRVPRSFSLDPALYGPPQAQPSRQLYPLLRGATVLTALLFVFVLGLGLINGNLGGGTAASSDVISMVESAPAAMPLEIVTGGELENQAADEAETGITMEEAAPLAESLESSFAQADTAAADETPSEDMAEELAPAAALAEESPREAAAIAGKEFTGTVEALATANFAELSGGMADESIQDPVAASAFALPPEEEPVPTSTPFPVWGLVIGLGIATIIFGLLTLVLRSRDRL
ncbi:MAG: hypothetical protein R3C44_06980 [Chloroflexota bacterium]